VIVATGIAWERFWISSFGSTLRELCDRYDVDLHHQSLRVLNDSKHYHAFGDYKNIITWGCYHGDANKRLASRNVLYLENDLFADRDYFYLDAYGWQAESSLVQCNFNREEPTMQERDEAFSYLESKYDMELFEGPKKDGYLLVCLQSSWEIDQNLLETVNAYASDFDVVIRGHPRYDKESSEVVDRFLLNNKNWELESTEVQLSSSLDGARAVVTNFSTVSFPAMFRGIPCATLMTGYFTNSRSTFECDKNPSMLRHMRSYEFDREAAEKMLISIFKNRVRKDLSVEDLLENAHVASWIVGLRR